MQTQRAARRAVCAHSTWACARNWKPRVQKQNKTIGPSRRLLAHKHWLEQTPRACCVVLRCAVQGPRCPLQIRVLFHCAQRQNNDEKLMQFHAQLTEAIEDQLSLASVHYARSHFQVRRAAGSATGGAPGIAAPMLHT